MTRFVSLPILLATISPAHAQPMTLAPGTGFEVERYAVALRPDLATTAIAGTETIALRATSDRVTQLAFSANSLRIEGATIGSSSVQVASGKDAIVFTLPRPLSRGDKATLRFRFSGTPARGVTAISAGLYTSYFACDWDGLPTGLPRRQGASGARPVSA